MTRQGAQSTRIHQFQWSKCFDVMSAGLPMGGWRGTAGKIGKWLGSGKPLLSDHGLPGCRDWWDPCELLGKWHSLGWPIMITCSWCHFYKFSRRIWRNDMCANVFFVKKILLNSEMHPKRKRHARITGCKISDNQDVTTRTMSCYHGDCFY